ncbi:glycosyltransferase [Candidatus Microgenomates bacterium]|nr:glycosyltransferase [Candidatus Microgenomates bacterium]
MKIAMISYWSCPLTRLGVLRSGGMNVYVLNLADQLGRMGHQVDIFTSSHKENDDRVISVNPKVKIIHLPRVKKDLYKDVSLFAQKVIDYINDKHLAYDILHGHYFYSGLIGKYLKNEFNLPLVVSFHSLGYTKDKFGGIKDRRRIRAEKDLIGTVDLVIASTEIEKQDLIDGYALPKEKITIVSPGVNHYIFRKHRQSNSREKLHLPQTKKIILFVGRIDPIKDISFLIEAVDLLANQYRSFKNNFRVLLIGGDINSRQFWQTNEVKKIKKLIEDKKLCCCVKFIGSRPHNLLPYYYSSSDVVVMPSKYESFGLVVLEAMACEGAIIASRAGGLQYLVKDKINGRLFDSGNVEQLKNVLWELLNDPKQRKALGQSALKYSQSFCWDKQAKKIIKIYRDIVQFSQKDKK